MLYNNYAIVSINQNCRCVLKNYYVKLFCISNLKILFPLQVRKAMK